MATNINVMYSNWRIGTNVTIARRLVDVTVAYTNAAGQPQMKSGTITFPDILNQLSTDDLKELALDIVFRAYRRTQGID